MHTLYPYNYIYIVLFRFKRSIAGKEKLLRRRCLDRRRLEEAFLLYAVLKMHFEYDLCMTHVDFDRNLLVEGVVEVFRERFIAKWTGITILNYILHENFQFSIGNHAMGSTISD